MAVPDSLIQGTKCCLRKPRLSDGDAYHRWYQNYEVQRYLANVWWDQYISRTDYVRDRFSKYLLDSPSSGVLTVCDYDDQPLGMVNYFDLYRDGLSCEVGIVIGESDKWGSGIGYEALTMLAKYLQSSFRLKFLKARILPENIISIRLFEKAGFYLVGETVEEEFHFLCYRYDYSE